MTRVVDRLFRKCGPDRVRRLKNVSRETFGGLENQPVKRVGEPWLIEGDLYAAENVALYRFENGVRGIVVVTPYRAGVNYVRFYRLIGEPVSLLKEYFAEWGAGPMGGLECLK